MVRKDDATISSGKGKEHILKGNDICKSVDGKRTVGGPCRSRSGRDSKQKEAGFYLDGKRKRWEIFTAER